MSELDIFMVGIVVNMYSTSELNVFNFNLKWIFKGSGGSSYFREFSVSIACSVVIRCITIFSLAPSSNFMTGTS